MSRAYVLITPARNEEKHVERVLNAVTTQSILPVKYVVVSDGSTDKTDAIVESYTQRFQFVELVRFVRQSTAGWGAKVLAFNAGYARMTGLPYSFIGNLDADVSFEPDYFSLILKEFDSDAQLGLAGGLVHELDRGRFSAQKMSDNSVAGPVQLFRRSCFEEIGGYIPMKLGGEDAGAEIMARMHGWRVRTIRSCRVWAHRPVRTGKTTVLGQRFNRGIMNYTLGYHPLFQLAASVRRWNEHPPLIGSLWTLAGYLWATVNRPQRQLATESVTFLRKEQLQRLRGSLTHVSHFLRG